MQETNTKLTKKRTNETEREIQRRDYQAKNRRKYKKTQNINLSENGQVLTLFQS